MIVEDDAYIGESLTELLEDEGYRIVRAGNGAEALAILRQGSPAPDLILLDLMMPVKDGFEFRHEQRADAKLAGIPVIVMTADASAGARIRELEVRAWVRKPLDIGRIVELIAEHARSPIAS